MPKFHALPVSEVRRETDDCVSIAFDVPAELAKQFEFIPGQYLTLRQTIDGEDVRRSYSICESPRDGELRVAVKKVAGGVFSTYANEDLHAGDVLQVMTPMGRFKLDANSEASHTYVFMAAGSGITPVMSMVKTILSDEPHSRALLFYGNRSSKTIIFKEELEDLKNKFLGRLAVYHVLSGESADGGMGGRIDQEKLARWAGRIYDPLAIDHFFLCGPGNLIETVRETLKEQGVPDERVHFELFTTPQMAAANAGAPTKEVLDAHRGKQSRVQVTLDGNSHTFSLDYDGLPVLDAALNAGADVPYACKGAVCATCKAKVVSGEVSMDMNYSLEPDELANGFVLTCQAHPRSEEVHIDFDV